MSEQDVRGQVRPRYAAAAEFVDAEVTFTHETAPDMHGAIVRATKPAAA